MLLTSLFATLRRLGVALVGRTERRSEEQSRVIDNRFLTIFNTTNDAIFTHDLATGAILEVNDRASELFGYTREEMIAGNVGTVSSGRPGYSQADAMQLVAAATTDRTPPFEWELKSRDGRVFWGEVSLRRMAFGAQDVVLATVRDIDDRKRRDELLQASESRFRMLVEQAPDAILVYDVDDERLVDANRSAERLFASPKAVLLANGPPGLLSTSSPPAPVVGETMADLARRAFAGEDVVLERAIQDAAGNRRVCEVRVAPLPSAERRLLRVSFNDITERKRSEGQLRLANRLLASEIESAPDGVLVVESSPFRATFNRKFVDMWGISEAAARGGDPETILSEVSAVVTAPEEFRAAVNRFRLHPDVPIHRELELRDGRVVEWHTGGIERAPGDPLARINFFRDITLRKQAERELQFANTLRATTMETSPDAILVVDDAGRVASFNRRFVELWRIPPSMIEAGDDKPVLAAVTAQVRDPETFLARIRYLYEHPEEQANDEIITTDGRFIERHTSGLTAPGGQSLGRVWFFRDVSDARRAAASLRDERDFVAALLANLPGFFALFDESGRIIRWNENLLSMLDRSADQIRELEMFSVVVEADRATAKSAIRDAFRDGHGGAEVRVRASTGLVRTIQFTGQAIAREGHSYLLGVGVDTTDARDAEASLRASEERFRAVSDTAFDAIIMIDEQGRVRYWNRAAERILGYSAAEAGDQRIREWLVLRDVRPDANGDVLGPAFSGDGVAAGTTLELVATRKDGVEIPIELAVSSTMLGSERYAVGILRDITERKRSEEQIARMARFDGLTGLANRGVFVEALQQAIARARRGGPKFAVLYIDLDHFKDVNDTLGHPIGDLLLQSVAHRLQACVRQGDTVARFGGDEFAVIETDLREPTDAAVLAAKLLAAVSEPVTIEGNEIRSGTSAGIAVFGADSPDAETLLSHADVALYRAKAEGRGTYRFFTDVMDAEVRTRVVVGAELREAIPTGQFFLLYQPQVALATGRIIGLEALVRWRHPTRGILLPETFIHIAERSGLIVPLGRWVMRQACVQAREWLDAGIGPALVAVNLSALQFKTPLELEHTIDAILEETRLPPNQLELELTESVLMEASREHNDVLIRLRQKGIRIAIDDFGNGYSSLDYLRRFRVDRIKIAQSFTADLIGASGSAPIVRAALGLARELGIEVVVEGVETAAQIELLKGWGSRAVQGYYYARPLSVARATALLKIGSITPAAEDSRSTTSPVGSQSD